MDRARPACPKWLQRLIDQAAAAARAPARHVRWRRALCLPLPQRLLVHGLLRYAPPALESDALRATGACCGLGQPLASPLGIHGLHLFLTDETQEAEASVLLLTPAACARLRSDRATEHTGTRTCPLTEPLPALETKRHRAEFVVRDAVYGLDTPEPDLLTGLTIEVTVWRHS